MSIKYLFLIFHAFIASKNKTLTLVIDSRPEWEQIVSLSFEDRAKFYQQRTDNIASHCQKQKQTSDFRSFLKSATKTTLPLILDQQHKLLYCEIPKVGSTNWKRILIKLTDPRFKDIRNVLAIRKPRKSDHYNLTYITDLPESERWQVLKSYKAFTFVRHPFERLLSAYRDKASEEFRGETGQRILHFFKSSGNAEKFTTYDVESFHKFLQYVIAANDFHKEFGLGTVIGRVMIVYAIFVVSSMISLEN